MQSALFTVLLFAAVASAANNSSISTRMFAGYYAVTGQYPWQASIVVSISGGTRFGGGALIHTQWVVTVAHNVVGATSAAVRLGSLLRLQPATPITVPSANIFSHFAFNATLLHNDLALLKLPSAVTTSSTIQTIALLPAPKVCDTNRYFSVSGWGAVAIGGAPVDDLRHAKQSEVSQEFCMTKHAANKIMPTTLCANMPYGPPYVSPCTGDDGGPLVQLGNASISLPDYLVGLFSFINTTTGCNTPDPAAYIQVTPYKAWINSKCGNCV